MLVSKRWHFIAEPWTLWHDLASDSKRATPPGPSPAAAVMEDARRLPCPSPLRHSNPRGANRSPVKHQRTNRQECHLSKLLRRCHCLQSMRIMLMSVRIAGPHVARKRSGASACAELTQLSRRENAVDSPPNSSALFYPHLYRHGRCLSCGADPTRLAPTLAGTPMSNQLEHLDL